MTRLYITCVKRNAPRQRALVIGNDKKNMVTRSIEILLREKRPACNQCLVVLN